MQENTKKIIKQYFKEYYENSDIQIRDIEKREFGVGFFRSKIEKRHLGFEDNEQFKQMLIEHVPLYVSHSTARYEFPTKRPMEAKNDLCYELVFDIDCQTKTDIITLQELENGKQILYRLIEDFLINDFGFDKKEISINFSGNRGFHIYVNSERIKKITKKARAKMLDYIINGTEYDLVFNRKSKTELEGPSEKSTGLRYRIYRRFMKDMEKKEFRNRIYRRFDEIGLNLFLNGIKNGNWASKYIPSIEKKLGAIMREYKQELCCDVDKQVTIEPRKLIRVVETLHGSTGLVVKKMSLSDVEKFNPFDSAIPNIRSKDEQYEIIAKKNIEPMEFNKKQWPQIKKGEKTYVDKSYAVFLALKQFAEIGGKGKGL